MSNKETWKEPKASTINLSDGTTAEAEVNGYGLSLHDGWVFVNGREFYVRRGNDGEWYEQVDPGNARRSFSRD